MKPWPIRSRKPPGWRADMMPIGMPMASQTTTPPKTSESVAGMRSTISFVTGC